MSPPVNQRRQPLLADDAGGRFVVDDVRWGWADTGGPRLTPTFQRTTLDPARVREVQWWSESFPPEWIAAHGQLAFVMDAPDAVVGEDGRGDLGFVFSVEPFFEIGERFDPLRGLVPGAGYPLVHLLTTLTDRVQRAAVLYRQKITAYRLVLTPAQARDLAAAAITDATLPREEVRYHTTRKSCVTEAVKVLNKVLPEAERIPRWVIPGVLHNPDLSLPRRTPPMLVQRGLATRWRSFDHETDRLVFEPPGSEPIAIEIGELPGRRAPEWRRTLDAALNDYAAAAQAYRQLEDARAAGAPGELDPAREALDQGLVRVTETAAAHAAEAVPYLLTLERPETPQAAALVDAVARRIRVEIAAGRYEPAPAHRAAIDALAPEPPPEAGEDPEVGGDDRPFVDRQRLLVPVAESPDERTFDDLRWGFVDVGGPRLKARFQRTTVRPGAVAEVFFWSESFPPRWIASHGQLAFLMADDGGVRGEDGTSDLGLVYSVEAHYRVGQAYNPLRGLHPRSEYGVIHTVTTLRDRVQWIRNIYRHGLESYRLLLTAAQKRDLLLAALAEGGRARPDERYHTTRRSCITGAFRTLNRVLPEDRRIPLWTVPGVLHNPRVSHPKWAPGLLVDMGLAEYYRTWDETDPVVTFERPGDTVAVDTRDLPGSRVPAEVRDLDNALLAYTRQAQAFRSLERHLTLTGPGAPGFFAQQAELHAAQGELDETREAVYALAVSDPEVTAPYLMDLERPGTPQAAAVIRGVAARLWAEVKAGRWQPLPDQLAALEAARAPGGEA